MQPTATSLAFDTDQEYQAIEAALLQTARGRWFLSEHGRRARRLDSAMLEEAIGRLQSSLRDPPALLGQLKNEIERVKGYLAETRADLATRPQSTAAPDRAPSGDASASAPQTILTAAEDIHELAWSLQAKAPDAESCEQIARHAAKLYAMSLQQAIESARLAKFAGALDEACAKLAAVLETIALESEDHSRSQPQPAPMPEPRYEQRSISAVLPPPPPLPSP